MAGSKHGTLTASTVATVVVDAFDAIEEQQASLMVFNVDGTAAIYYTLDGSTPTVAGDNTRVLPAAICSRSHHRRTGDQVTVKLISAGTPAYCVEGA
jgi:hypothetical protein